MNKKLKVFIATAIAIFFGLGIYTFAAPNDETETFNEGNTKEVDDNLNKENTKKNNYQQVVTNEKEEKDDEENNNQIMQIPQPNNVEEQNPVIQEEVQNVPEVDTTAPVVEVTYSTDKVSKEVTVTITSNEELQEVESWTLSEDKLTLTRVFNDNTEEKITIKDLQGNEVVTDVEIDNIDNVAPVITARNTVGKDGIYSKIDLTFSDNNKIVKTITNGKEVKRTPDKGMSQKFNTYKSLYVEGENTIEIIDEAGNSTTFTFVLDTTAPELTVKDSSIGKGSNYSLIDFKLYDNVGIEKVIVNENQEFTESFNQWGDFNYGWWINYVEGENTVSLYDRAGNSTSYTFTYDTKSAKISPVTVYAAKSNKDTITKGFVPSGYNIHIRFKVNEKLSETPIIVVNNGEETINLTTTMISENYYDATINSSKIADGNLTFKITNVKDLAGNLSNEVSKTTNNTWLIVDKTLPVIEGIENNEITNQDVELTITDTNINSVTFNNTVVELVDNKYTITAEGTYTVVATDKAGNTVSKSFTIDKTPAIVKAANILVNGDDNSNSVFYATVGDTILAYVRYNEKLIENPKFELISNNINYEMNNVTVSGPNAKGEYTYQATYTVNDLDMEEGEVTLLVSTISDLAGNVSSNVAKPTNGHKVIIDRIKPEVISQVQKYNETRNRIELTTEFNETVVTMGGNNSNVTTTKVTTYYFRTKNVTVSYEDLAGNKNTYEVAIDMTAPKLKINYSETNPTNNDVVATVTSNEALKEVEGWELSEDKLVLTKTFSANESGTVKVYDLAGNPKTIDYSIENIDKVSPTVKVTYSTKDLTNGSVILRFIANEKVQPVDGYAYVQEGTILRKFVDENESGTLTITDLAGNTTDVPYTINNIIDGTESLTDTINNSNESKINLKLEDDLVIETYFEVSEDKELVIDLNNKELELPSMYSKGNVEIKNGTINSGQELYVEGGSLKLDNVTLNVNGQGINGYDGNVVVENSTINATDWAVMIYGTGSIKNSKLTSTDNGYTIYAGGHITEISDVEIIQNGDGIGIYVEDGTVDLIENVSITTSGLGIDNYAEIEAIKGVSIVSGDIALTNTGTINKIESGVFTSKNSYSIFNYDGIIKNITSGTYEGKLGSLFNRGTSEFTKVSGGKFVKGTKGTLIQYNPSTYVYSEFTPTIPTNKKLDIKTTYTEVVDK